MDILRDAIWPFVGAAIAMVALFVSFWIYLRQKPIKVLVYETEFISLVRVHQSVKDDIQIMFRGQLAKSATMVTVKLSNRGSTPITRQDYDENVSIKFRKDAQLAVLDEASSSIHVEHKELEDNLVVLEPFLLNPAEEARFTTIMIGGTNDIEIRARLVGGNVVSIDQFERKLTNRVAKFVTNRDFIQGLASAVLFAIVATIIFSIKFLFK
ncbi:MAG: hypothetical protein ABSF67_07475 [Roseiarcus sp.]|jgi:hypothetical protein